MDESAHTSLHYLLKSSLLGLKLVSNYRSFLSLNAAFQLQKNPQTEQQMRQLYDDILVDEEQEFELLERLEGVIVRIPGYQSFEQLMQNIQEELQALTHDSASTQLLSSQVLHFSLKQTPVISDAISVLLSGAETEQSGTVELEQLQRTLLEEQQASLALEKELKYYQEQSATYKSTNPKTADRVLTLESENQLLTENIADLRRSLEQIQQENRNSKEIMAILKENMQSDAAARSQLQETNNKLTEEVEDLEQKTIPEAQIHAMQLVLQETLQIPFAKLQDGVSFIDTNGVVALQENINSVLTLALRAQAKIDDLAKERDGSLRSVAYQQQEAQRLTETIERLNSEMATLTDPERICVQEQQLEEIRSEAAQYKQELLDQEQEIAKLQQAEPEKQDTEEMNVLKQNFKHAIQELRQQIMNVYTALHMDPVEGEEFELDGICQRCAQLTATSEQYDLIRSELKGLVERGGDINAEIERINRIL